MSGRPAIPQELRRSVLVEAGHRCAIQTCRDTAHVDVHHIIPWAESKEHVFDELIALCPNCHRRADAGEIDRKSLRLYKARLAAAFGGSSSESITRKSEHPWEAAVIADSVDQPCPFDLMVEYPIFHVEGAETINAIESGAAFREAAEFRGDLLERQHIPSMPDSRLTGTFSVLHFDHRLISLRIVLSHYRNGSAHGGQRSVTRTYLRGQGALLEMRHFVGDLSTALEATARYCMTVLAAELGDGAQSDLIRKGTAPTARNYEKWNVTPAGLLVTFDEYSVAPYAAGRRQVLVPFEVVSEFATPLLRGVVGR